MKEIRVLQNMDKILFILLLPPLFIGCDYLYCLLSTEKDNRINQAAYIWKIHNFSKDAKGRQVLWSPPFQMDRLYWYLSFHPHNSSENPVYNSLFLHSRNNIPVRAKGSLSIINSVNKKYRTVIIPENTLFESHTGLGFSKFIVSQLLMHANNEILTNDTLTILCEIIIDSSLYNSLNASSFLLKKQKNFYKLFKNEQFSDVLFMIGNENIPAHKILLINRSTIFKAMLDDKMNDSQQYKVVIKDIEYKIMEDMLHFIYDESTFEFESEEHAGKLLIAAQRYKISELLEKCERYLSDKLTIDNVIKLLNLSFTMNVTNLRKDSLNFINRHAKELEPQFKSIGELPAALIAEVMIVIVRTCEVLKRLCL